MDRSELIVGLVFLLAAAVPSMLVLFWRRLRNLAALESAKRQARIAVRMACTAQEAAAVSGEQLAACRVLLVEAMQERDQYQRTAAHLAGKIIELERQRRHDRLMARTWLTKTVGVRKVSEN